MLDEFDLTWVILREMVAITSKEKADEVLTTKVYPVSDLIGSPPNFGPLMNIITGTIRPDSWDDNGGPGGIYPCPTGSLLVISQKREVHEEIAELLVSIRRQTGTEPRTSSGGLRRATGSGQSVIVDHWPRSASIDAPVGNTPHAGSRGANTAIYLSNPDGLQIVGGLYGATCRVRPDAATAQSRIMTLRAYNSAPYSTQRNRCRQARATACRERSKVAPCTSRISMPVWQPWQPIP